MVINRTRSSKMCGMFFSGVEYNKTCYELEDGENACGTINAACIPDEKRCLCKNDDVYIEARDQCFHSMFTFLFILIVLK